MKRSKKKIKSPRIDIIISNPKIISKMLGCLLLFLILATVNSTSKNDEGKQRLFLHIGPHKTASTYIQSVLSSEVRSILYNTQIRH